MRGKSHRFFFWVDAVLASGKDRHQERNLSIEGDSI